MIHQLIKIANTLDAKGYYQLASQVDVLLKTAVSQSDLIRALKNNSKTDAMRALSEFIKKVPYGSTPQQELGMTDQEFRVFTNDIRNDNLGDAREALGIKEDIREVIHLFKQLVSKLGKPSSIAQSFWATGGAEIVVHFSKDIDEALLNNLGFGGSHMQMVYDAGDLGVVFEEVDHTDQEAYQDYLYSKDSDYGEMADPTSIEQVFQIYSRPRYTNLNHLKEALEKL